ncbi:MAG: ROK family protein [Phycisphaerae bacterium]|nr:ROK family protein [Phycisphaerae bacterium]
MSGHRIGIDLGGTKIEVVAMDEGHRELHRERVATPKGEYDGTIEAIRGLVARAEATLGRVHSIGIGTPGSTSPASGLHRNSNSICLNGRPLHADLERALGRPIAFTNDANCFALSEASLGAARGTKVVFGVILGTGVGGGVVVDGRVVHGRNGIGGEWGHSPLPWRPGHGEAPDLAGRPCYCGQCGCREQFLSGPAIEAEYLRDGGEALALAEIARRAESGDARAAAAIERFCTRLALSLADVVNLLDPDCIVLGGGVSNLRAIESEVPKRVAQLVFSDTFTTPIVRAALGDSSGVFGAALLANPSAE